MAIPTFIYDEDLKEFYNETGEETIIAVKGDYRSRAIRFKVPIQINDGAASASYKLSDKDNFYIAWKNSNGDFGRMKAGASSVMSAISFEDDTCTVEFKVSKELTANEGDVYLALEVVEGGGDDFGSSVVRFAPVKAKIADFLSDDDKFSPKNDAIPSGLEAQAGIINSIYFDPVEKKLVASEALKTAFVRGDERGRQVDFAIPCELGGGASVWQGDTVEVMYKNANGETGSKRIRSDLLEFTSRRAYTGTIFGGDGESGGICRFQFYAPASLTAYEGDAEIQVSITKENGSTIHLSPAKLQVGPFFDQSAIEPEDPKYEIIEDLKASIKRLEGLITSNGKVSLDGYLTKNEAAEAYATLEGVNETYLMKTAAAGIYETAESASATYLTKTDAKTKIAEQMRWRLLSSNLSGLTLTSDPVRIGFLTDGVIVSGDPDKRISYLPDEMLLVFDGHADGRSESVHTVTLDFSSNDKGNAVSTDWSASFTVAGDAVITITRLTDDRTFFIGVDAEPSSDKLGFTKKFVTMKGGALSELQITDSVHAGSNVQLSLFGR